MESANSGKDASTKSNFLEAENPNFDVMNVSRSSLVSPKAFDPQCGGSVSQNLLANPEVEDAGNWDSDCFGLCSSPLPSGPFPSTTAEWSDPALKHDGMLSIESADDFSNQIGDHLLDLFRTNSDFDSSLQDRKGALQDIEPCSKHKSSCMVSALKILRTLHTAPSTCSSAGTESPELGSSQPRTTGCVLSANREVIRLVSNMLKCSCFASIQLQLILTVICSKLIVWYRAMIPNTYAYLDDSNTSLEENAERVLHQLITVGEYAVDNRLEPRIRAEIVLGELQHVEALIKNLARCLQERKYVSRWNAAAASGGNRPTSPSKPMGPNETAAAGAIHKRLTEFLHDKLQVGRAGIHAMVDRGHDPTDLSV